MVEPTCGLGNFVLAALDRFPSAKCIGSEINPVYVEKLTATLAASDDSARCRVTRDSFFDMDWRAVFRDMPEPVLVLGNPPWITNAQLGVLGSTNLPEKSNFQRHLGLDALTGKSNFDISEWMIIRLLERWQVAAGGWRCFVRRRWRGRCCCMHGKTGLPSTGQSCGG